MGSMLPYIAYMEPMGYIYIYISIAKLVYDSNNYGLLYATNYGIYTNITMGMFTGQIPIKKSP